MAARTASASGSVTGSAQLGQLVEGARGVERERPDAGAAQRGQVPADAERGTQVAGQRAHVGAGRALDRDVDVEQLAASGGTRSAVEPGDRDRPGRQLDVLARRAPARTRAGRRP